MKLSESTINVLKNFATINAGMQFKEGSVVRTISKGQNVLGKATVTEAFEKDFVIYDLNRFRKKLQGIYLQYFTYTIQT